MTNWPAMPDGAVVLHESSQHFSRIYIAPRLDGWQIVICGRLQSSEEEPPLSKEKVIEIANKLIAEVSK